MALAGPAEGAPPEAAAPDPADAADDAPPDGETSTPPGLPDPGKPPRIDGPYLGGVLGGGLSLVRVNGLDTGPFTSFGGALRFGEYMLPWLGIGLSIGGTGGVRSAESARQTLGAGQLAVEFSFVPAPRKIDLQLRTSFGFGGGAVREEGRSGRSGFGGAVFGAAARYEWFPWAAKRRAYRGGGFGLGPELGWIGFTPAAKGRPMSNTIYLAIATTFYFGS
jgi:hypothetical protein